LCGAFLNDLRRSLLTMLPPKKEKILLLLLAAIQFTNIVDFMIMMPMGKILQDTLHITPAQYGILVSSYGLSAGITSLAGVFYLDRLDRKKALLTAYVGFIIGTMSSAWLPNTNNPELNYYLFIGTRILTGITGGLMSGLVLSIIGDTIPLERRGKAMATVTISFSLASIIGMPISLSLVDAFDNNWHVPFFAISLMSTVVLFFCLRHIPPMRAHLMAGQQTNPWKTFSNAFATPSQRSALAFTLLLVVGQFTVISLMTPYYICNVGIQQSDIKYIYLVGGIATVFGGMMIGKLVDKLGRFRVFTIFALLSIIPIWIVTNLGAAPLWALLILAAFFMVFISGRMIPANTITSAVVPPQYRAGFMSLNAAAMSLGSGSSAALAGAMVSQAGPDQPFVGYDMVGYVAIGATLLSLLMIRILKAGSIAAH
jgi:MFS transporter, DHA1 family, inner membrane transport protein